MQNRDGPQPGGQAMSPTSPPASDSFEGFAQRVARAGRHLSPKLRQIADYVLHHPEEVALETVSGVARRAGVAPSAVVRFAQAMGFGGFTEMQRLFRERLVDRLPSYAERIREAETHGAEPVLASYVRAATAALAQLPQRVAETELLRAAGMVLDAELVHLVGQRRSFPVAAYLAYALCHLGLRARLFDGAGGMLALQATTMSARDLLVAVSFRPYAPETLAVVERAVSLSVPVLAITDMPSSPLAAKATQVFFIEEAEVQGVRGLAVASTLAAALVLAAGRQLVGGEGGGLRNIRSGS